MNMATVVDLLNWHKLVHLFMRPEGVHCLTVQKSTGWREEGVPDSGRPVFHFSVPLAWGEEWDQSMMGVGWRQHCCGLCREGSEGPGTFPAVFTLCRCLQSTTEQLPINTIAGQEAPNSAAVEAAEDDMPNVGTDVDPEVFEAHLSTLGSQINSGWWVLLSFFMSTFIIFWEEVRLLLSHHVTRPPSCRLLDLNQRWKYMIVCILQGVYDETQWQTNIANISELPPLHVRLLQYWTKPLQQTCYEVTVNSLENIQII